MSSLERRTRTRAEDPRSVPWALDGSADLVVVDTTWGRLQPLEAAAGVRTVGELELLELLEQGAMLVDSRVPGSFGGVTIPGAVNIPHDQTVPRRGELDPEQLVVLFCNGPQCPQSPDALSSLVKLGHPAAALAYYRGGMHDWVSLAMPTQAVEDS